jgi:hypothetical protein
MSVTYVVHLFSLDFIILVLIIFVKSTNHEASYYGIVSNFRA